MTLINNQPINTVNTYIKLVNMFLNKQSNDFQEYNNYSVIQIFSIIGKYNLVDQLKEMLNNNKLIDYYKYINLFHSTMFAAVYYNNNEIIDILANANVLNITIDDYKTIIDNSTKCYNNDITELKEL